MPDSLPPAAMPRIRRARGYRLYDAQGRRYLDLAREGALLGHRAAGAVNAMKSALSQGLAASLATAWETRLSSRLARLFPGWPTVRLYSSGERAFQAVAAALGGASPVVADPALDPPADSAPVAALWRPFLPVAMGARVLVPVLPFTVCGAPAAVCFAGDLADRAPCSDPVPGFLLAGALRALAAVMPPAAADDGPPAAATFLACPRVEKAIDAGTSWIRVGPYVRAAFPREAFTGVHARFLRAGVVLCPRYPGPSVLPGDCSPGETRLLADLFAASPGG